MTGKKILHLTDCDIGGVPAVINLLLKNIGGAVIFIGKNSQAIDGKYIIESGIKFHRSLNPLKIIKNYIGLYYLVKKYDPEILHAHSAFAGVYGSFLSMHLKLPLVYTPHASPAMIPDSSILMRVITQFEKITLYLSEKVIACSPDEASILLRTSKKKEAIVIIPNGIESFYKYTDDKELDIVAVGRICEQKRPDIFIKIAEKLKIRNPKLKIGWIGPGLKIENNAEIIWYSELSEKKVENLLSKTTLFLSTSNYEGLSLAALKAAVAGCYLFLRNTIGTRAPINLGSAGYIFENIDDAVDEIEKILENEILITQSNRETRAFKNLQIFNFQKQVDLHKKLYRNIVIEKSN